MDEDADSSEWTDYMNLQDYKDIIDSNWNVHKEDDDSYETFEKEFSIRVTDSFKTKNDKQKWINDLISFSKAWTTTKGRPLSLAEVNEIKTILQSLLPIVEN
jgi:DNA sulfur modification protein DndB